MIHEIENILDDSKEFFFDKFFEGCFKVVDF